jgi:hypothetical protein
MTEQTLERSAIEEMPAFDSADVIEIPLLLSGRQILALEEAAFRRGMTAAEMVRHLVYEFIAQAVPCKVGRT